MNYTQKLLLVAAAACLPASAFARTIDYNAVLNGNNPTNQSGSAATGTATVSVDTEAKTVAVTLSVNGLTTEALWDNLVGAPIGPIHLHQYANNDVNDPNGSQLAFPLPFGASYSAKDGGFNVETGARAYAEGAAPLGARAPSFEAFVAALEAGGIVVNIHTDGFNAGEISGQLVPSTHAVAPMTGTPDASAHHNHGS